MCSGAAARRFRSFLSLGSHSGLTDRLRSGDHCGPKHRCGSTASSPRSERPRLARLGSARFLGDTPGRRPASSHQPSAGLPPRLPLSLPPIWTDSQAVWVSLPGTVGPAGCRVPGSPVAGPQGRRTRFWRLYTCHVCIFRGEPAPPLRRLLVHKTERSFV